MSDSPQSIPSSNQHVIVIDRSPVEVLKSEEGKIVAIETSGGAGKVAIGQAAALGDQGARVVFIAVAKSGYEKELARQGKAFHYEYGGRDLEINFVDIPDRTYKHARDGFFSGHLWFYLQSQAHPKIMQPWRDVMWSSYAKTNQLMSDRVNQVAERGANVWVHDAHFALVGSQLRHHYRKDLMLSFIGHTAWPHRSFVQNEIENAHSLPHRVLKDLVKGLKAYDFINFSSPVWAENLRETADVFNMKLPPVSAVPVPLDAEFVRAAADTKAVQKRTAALEAELDGKQLVIAGGRAEWYKNIDKLIDAEVLRIKSLPPEKATKTLTVLLTSVTRGTVPGYQEHYDDIEAKTRAANEELGFTALKVVDGNNAVEKFAHMKMADVMVTAATEEGYNLMALEQRAVATRPTVHVMSRSMGLTHHLESLTPTEAIKHDKFQIFGKGLVQAYRDPFAPGIISINPTMVKLSGNPATERREQAILDMENLTMSVAVQSALDLPHETKIDMFNDFGRVLRDMTPESHTKKLNAVALEVAAPPVALRQEMATASVGRYYQERVTLRIGSQEVGGLAL